MRDKPFKKLCDEFLDKAFEGSGATLLRNVAIGADGRATGGTAKHYPKKGEPKMAKTIPTVTDDTAEADDLLKQIEGIEQRLQSTEALMKKQHEAYKGTKAAYDDLIQEMRAVAKTRLEETPLFDGEESEG